MESGTTLVSPPQQGRSRLAWARILEAGGQILEAEGLENFTIAAICERAQVSSAAIYSRVSGKDDLFLAVYEQTLDHMTEEREQLDELATLEDLSLDDFIRRTVETIAHLFLRRAGFVRSVVWLSSTNEQVRRRGSEWMTELGQLFATLISSREEWGARDVARELDVCYRILWSTIAIYIAHGPDYASQRPISDEEFVHELSDVALRYLARE
jgi:AcrR family transcriptional regulator